MRATRLSGQVLQWPRTGTGVDGVDDTMVPTDFVNGSIELALSLVDGSTVQTDPTPLVLRKPESRFTPGGEVHRKRLWQPLRQPGGGPAPELINLIYLSVYAGAARARATNRAAPMATKSPLGRGKSRQGETVPVAQGLWRRGVSGPGLASGRSMPVCQMGCGGHSPWSGTGWGAGSVPQVPPYLVQQMPGEASAPGTEPHRYFRRCRRGSPGQYHGDK